MRWSLGEFHLISDTLQSGDGKLAERLIRAGRELERLSADRQHWPEDLRQAADLVLVELLQHGSVEASVARMNALAMLGVAERLLALCARAAVASGP